MHCVHIYTLTHTVASPKENQSSFFFFPVEKFLLLFSKATKSILLTSKSWCPRIVLWTHALLCCSSAVFPPELGCTAARAGGALCAANAVRCTAVLGGWRGRRDLLSSCCFPWGKGEKKGSGQGKLKMLVVIENNNPFLPRLPLLVVCISMQWISGVTDLKQYWWKCCKTLAP